MSAPPWIDSTQTAQPAQGGRSLVDAELMVSAGWMIRLRWVAGVGVLLITLLVAPLFKLQVPLIPLLGIGIAILLYNLVFLLVERRLTVRRAPPQAYRWLAIGQVALDWLAMTLLIHFSGGIESPVIFFFFIHIVIVSIFFPPRIAYAFALLAVALLSLVAGLEYSGSLPHAPIVGLLPFPLYDNLLYVLAVLGFFASTALIVAYLVTNISERLRRREEEVVALTESIQRAADRLQAINEGARVITSSLDLPQVLNSLVKNTSEVMEVRACSIRLLDQSGRLEPVATYGLSQAYLDKGPVELESNPLARQVLAGEVVNIADITQSELLQYPERALQEGILSMLSAPLTGKKGVFGILRAYSTEKGHFTQEDESFLAAIAAQGSIAIENAMAYQAIETLDATKSTFVRMVTHELRSPVSVTRSLLRTITAGYAGEVNPQQREMLERASRRIEFLQKLIDDLLDMAAGKVQATTQDDIQPVSLDAVLERVVSRFEVPAGEKDVALTWEDAAADEANAVLATEDGLDRIFNNLVSNAVKYTPAGGKVTVKLTHVGEEAWVTVEDTGIGIPEEALGHLFEEFYRAANAKEVEREGTGLGLVIVKDLVERFGGRVAVQSTLGEGTRFTVSFPLTGETEEPALSNTPV